MDNVLSGMRPTGKLHLGHLHGVLNNWVKLQNKYDCYYFAADWHALTSEFKNTIQIKDSIYEMIADWLSVGINPEKSVVFIQSHIKEHAELHLLLSMITPLGWLERNPTYKELKTELSNKDINTLLPVNKAYYRFDGSLTTPPCSEGVRWFVLKNYMKISESQVEEFLNIMHHHNNRPVQPLNARKVMQ
jgi:tryptophanyl-tRNA synthetase